MCSNTEFSSDVSSSAPSLPIEASCSESLVNPDRSAESSVPSTSRQVPSGPGSGCQWASRRGTYGTSRSDARMPGGAGWTGWTGSEDPTLIASWLQLEGQPVDRLERDAVDGELHPMVRGRHRDGGRVEVVHV